MSWFLFALVCMLGWGLADLFYKRGTDENDQNSQFKIAVWVGLVMGLSSFVLLFFTETKFSLASLLENALKYTPASLAYIISMVIGYAGLRYLELSIVSPVQNASGALSAVVMFLYFLFVGRITDFSEEFGVLDIVGTCFIVLGVIALGVVEQRLSSKEKAALSGLPSEDEKRVNRKYKYGALALLFPVLYCIFDTVGTAADGVILDGEAGLGLGEIDVLVLYGLTFFLAGIVCYVIIWVREKRPYNPFRLQTEWPKMTAAVAEEFGQVFYVFAMAARPMLAAPLVASYCIVSMILSRIFLKEKLKAAQYVCLAAVVLGIVILGIAEGLGEAEETASVILRIPA